MPDKGFGILYYDNSGRSIEERVGEAIERFTVRVGRKPNIVFVPESDIDTNTIPSVDGVEVEVNAITQPKTLWAGLL